MSEKNNKIKTFMRKNALYFILALCVLAVGLSITFVLLSQGEGETIQDTQISVEDPITPSEPTDNVETPITPSEPVVKVVTFIMPVANATEIGEYSESMVFNSTLNRFSAHKAIDFYAEEGADVYACYDGTVESVENTLLEGATVTINHGNGLKTVYNSLADGESVTVGQTVKQGDVIGKVSVTNRQEASQGAHLHFEVIENDVNIDPSKYLTVNEK